MQITMVKSFTEPTKQLYSILWSYLRYSGSIVVWISLHNPLDIAGCDTAANSGNLSSIDFAWSHAPTIKSASHIPNFWLSGTWQEHDSNINGFITLFNSSKLCSYSFSLFSIWILKAITDSIINFCKNLAILTNKAVYMQCMCIQISKLNIKFFTINAVMSLVN